MAQNIVPLHKALVFAERFRREGRFAEAEALCRRLLDAQPNSYEAEHMLGAIAHQTGRLGEAIEHFRRVVQLAPDIALHHANLGEIYRLVRRFDAAAASSCRALALNTELPAPLNNLARIALIRGETQLALDYSRQALALKPDFADGHNNLGNALKQLGQLEEARQAYLNAIKLDPHAVDAYVNFAELHKFVPSDPFLAAMEGLAAKSDGLSKTDRLFLDFALGKAYADLEDYRRSFRHYLSGNAGLRATITYDAASTLAMFDHIEAVFTPELIEAKSGSGDPSKLPIFVVGMPRSGTTLVEQILASHPNVHGAGELSAFYEAMLSVQGPDGTPIAGPKAVSTLDGRAFTEIGSRYVKALRERDPDAVSITDKRPDNYYFIGLIHLALPNAKIIHVMRDPIDSCVSCFTMYFSPNRMGLQQTYDLAELGRYYRRYEQLMAHWRRVLPGRILDVRYEDIVADLEGQARRMLDHCGLPWDENCLGFYRTKRPVLTASAAQVRQPIYRSSVGRWRVYEEFLGPLLAELNGTAGHDAAEAKR